MDSPKRFEALDGLRGALTATGGFVRVVAARSASSAHGLFLLLASVASAIMITLVPPVWGGNEMDNFQRAASIAVLHPMVEPASVPAGIAQLYRLARRQLPSGAHPPFHFSRSKFAQMRAISLHRDTLAPLDLNPVAVLNPVAYLPQVIAFWVGFSIDAAPLTILYLARLFGAATGIALTYFAIRRMPFRNHTLAAIALLPTISYMRSVLDADQVTNGLAFLFIATVLEFSTRQGLLERRSIAFMAVLSLLLAQCKSAYLLVPLFALIVPVSRYGSTSRWLAANAVVIVPGIIMSLAWMLALKHGYFAGIHYRTISGRVYPDQQWNMILASPLRFVGILLGTVFSLQFISSAILSLVGSISTSYPLPLPVYVLVFLALAFAIASEGAKQTLKSLTRAQVLSVGILLSTAAIILTLLYLQWTAAGKDQIDGFQGRYLYPVLPLLVLFLPFRPSTPYFGIPTRHWVLLVAIASTLGTAYQLVWIYWT